MLRSWPDSTLKVAHDTLSELWLNQKEVPEFWRWRILAPKPKTTEDDAPLTALRPLMLIEITRKTWMSIFVHRIQKALVKYQLLHLAQHGYIVNRGTDTASLELIAMLEERRVRGGDLYLSS